MPALGLGDTVVHVKYVICDTLVTISVTCPCVRAGNTCFLNSVLQVLYYTPTFVDNVNVLYEEMRATINDNCSVRTLAVSMH